MGTLLHKLLFGIIGISLMLNVLVDVSGLQTAEVEKVKTVSNTFCQIAYGQPRPDPPHNWILLHYWATISYRMQKYQPKYEKII
jgi:hypothetical protein